MNVNLLIKNNDWLIRATNQLTHAGIGTAQLDSLVLLEDALGVNRAHILAHPDTLIPAGKLSQLNDNLQRRIAHEPLAYIRQKTEFYGREFSINNFVLEPRPESETMIEQLKKLCAKNPDIHTLIDVGTGSGALAITAQLELPKAKVLATDIDTQCLEVAKKNATCHNATTTIDFYWGNLLEPVKSQVTHNTSLLCNLPYVPDNFGINKAASHEPRLAIFGGPDGLDVYRALFAQIDALVTKPGYIFTEAMPTEHSNLAQLAQQHSYQLRLSDDFIQLFELA